MAAAQAQGEFVATRVGQSRPLWPMKAVMAVAGLNEDQVLREIGERRLLWAFDMRSGKAQRAFVVVWRQAVEVFAQCRFNANSQPGIDRMSEGEVLARILPPRQRMRAREFYDLFAGSQGLGARLLAEGLIGRDGRTTVPACGRGHSPWVTTASVSQFLHDRRIA
jgi:hypothetical protein